MKISKLVLLLLLSVVSNSLYADSIGRCDGGKWTRDERTIMEYSRERQLMTFACTDPLSGGIYSSQACHRGRTMNTQDARVGRWHFDTTNPNNPRAECKVDLENKTSCEWRCDSL